MGKEPEMKQATPSAEQVSVPRQVPMEFINWLQFEMPPHTIISSAAWWAPRIWRAMLTAAPPAPAPSAGKIVTLDEVRFPNVYAAMNAHGLDLDAMKKELFDIAKEEGLLGAAYSKIAELEAKLRAALQAPQAQGFPMKDAPKDGTEILAFHIEGKTWHQVIWSAHRDAFVMRWNRDYSQTVLQYSGWQLLPPAPKGDGE